MKICISSQTFTPQHEGGAEISTRHLAQTLAHRHEVVVLALGMRGAAGAEPGEQRVDAPYRVHRLPFLNAYLPSVARPDVGFVRKALWHLRSGYGAVSKGQLQCFLEAERFDLIFAQNSARMQPALYEVAAALGLPVCQHLRDYALLCPKTSMYRDGRNCERPCLDCTVLTRRMRSASSTVHHAIAVSAFVKSRHQENGLFRNADVLVLHNTNTPRSSFDGGLLTGLPEPSDPFTFGYLGALTPEKGVDVMIDAFGRLPSSDDARLVIGGRGDARYVAYLKRKAAAVRPGRVEFLGHIDPISVYRRSEVVLVPSLWHEPQGRVLIEAAVYGIPVIAARTGGIPEIVENHHTGWCYAPVDVDGLSGLMRTVSSLGASSFRAQRDLMFPGLREFAGTAEDSRYYESIERHLEVCRTAGRKG